MAQGTLYLVGVPMGHDDDITYRAVKTLQRCPVVAAEDTRKAKRLLGLWNIKPENLISHGSHNEHQSSQGIIALLAQGMDVSYISDAGAPGISDPGYLLAKTVREEGFKVEVLPAPNAAGLAVVASGLPCDRFFFQGFLPKKEAEKLHLLERLAQMPETLIFYESPRRILQTLGDIQAALGQREATLCREMTKTHEEYIRGTLSQIQQNLAARENILGEMVLVVAGHVAQNTNIDMLEDEITGLLNSGLTPKDVRDEIAAKYNLPKKVVYEKVLALK